MQDPTAVIGKRIVAYIIDSLIIVAVTAILFFAVAESDPNAFDADQAERIGRAFGDADEDANFDATWNYGEAVGGFVYFDEDDFDFTIRIVEGGTFWLVNIVGFALSIGLLVVMQGATGKTPGKAVMRIATVAPDGSPPGFGKAILRRLLLFVDGFCILPGLITSLASKGHRRIGDMAAGTYVVDASAVGRPVQVDVPAPSYAVTAPGAPGAYGVPPPPSTYAPPPPPGGQAGPPAPDAQWDNARGAWIRWDGAQWQQHDPATGGWHPIS